MRNWLGWLNRRQCWSIWRGGPFMTSEELLQISDRFRAAKATVEFEVNVCMGTGCMSQHSDKLKEALSREAAAVTEPGRRCHVRKTGCMGLCAAGPLVLVESVEDVAEVRYGGVHESDARELIASLGSEPIERLETHLEHYFQGQQHIVLENSG